jgi:hypothetical protein
MTSPVQAVAYVGERKCPFCGKPVRGDARQCPFCREAIPSMGRVSKTDVPGGRRKIRRGLLYMLLALVIYYFAGGFSGLRVPLIVSPLVSHYLAPVLFLGGLGMVFYGFFLTIRS